MIGSSLLAMALACAVNEGIIHQPTDLQAAAQEVRVRVAKGQFVAFQDGDGPWQVLAHDEKKPVQTLTVTNPEGRYSVFQGPNVNSKQDTKKSRLFHRTLSDPKPMPGGPIQGGGMGSGGHGGKGNGQSGKIEGIVSHLPKDGYTAFQTNNDWLVLPETGAFSVNSRSGRKMDLIFAHFNGKQDDFNKKATAMLIQREVETGAFVLPDWNNAIPLQPTTVNITDVPFGMSVYGVSATFHTSTRGKCQLRKGEPETATSFEYPALPASAMTAKDFHILYAAAFVDDLEVEIYQKAASAPITLRMPQPFSPQAPTVVHSTPVRLAFNGVLNDFEAYIAPEKAGGPHWTILASKAWLKGQTTYTMPELHTLPGWQEACSLPKENIQVVYGSTIQEGEDRLLQATRVFTVTP